MNTESRLIHCTWKAWNHGHVEKFLFCQASGEWESSFHSVSGLLLPINVISMNITSSRPFVLMQPPRVTADGSLLFYAFWVFDLDIVCRGWLHALSEQGCINSKLSIIHPLDLQFLILQLFHFVFLCMYPLSHFVLCMYYGHTVEPCCVSRHPGQT